jgi:O-methyltransferase involved in polyketide biosynthesis
MEPGNMNNRNFNSISPSARTLLLMKGYTSIPFARKTAELIKYPEEYTTDFDQKDISFRARTVHFESRYLSIDQLLEDIPARNILELSSGFSFRGLEKVRQNEVYYIDTDLPEVIKIKKDFITVLNTDPASMKGTIELQSLDALNDTEFHEVVKHFPAGEIVIVNEGLLMYLNTAEKEKLCNTIHGILKERGGYWITADIYLKNMVKRIDIKTGKAETEFFEQHNIEDNKFESFEQALDFFKRMGFIIEREANVDKSKISSMKYLIKSLTIKQILKMRKGRRMQETWRLKPADASHSIYSTH